MQDVDNFLAHYGVKGMKWGVRRSDGSGSSGSSKPAPHEDAVKAKVFKDKVKKGSTDALSNDELQALVQRMNLEKQYKSLQPPTGAQRAKKFVADTLVNAGKQQATKAVSDQMSKRITRMLANAGK